jgi:hypothetical protein
VSRLALLLFLSLLRRCSGLVCAHARVRCRQTDTKLPPASPSLQRERSLLIARAARAMDVPGAKKRGRDALGFQVVPDFLRVALGREGSLARGELGHPGAARRLVASLINGLDLVDGEGGHADRLDLVREFTVDPRARSAHERVEVEHHVLVAAPIAIKARAVFGASLALLEDLLILLLKLLATCHSGHVPSGAETPFLVGPTGGAGGSVARLLSRGLPLSLLCPILFSCKGEEGYRAGGRRGRR